MRKRILAFTMCVIMSFGAFTTTIASADSVTIVSVGADLSEEQKSTMFNYFGTKKNEVSIIEVNNKEERKYLEGIATERQIGKRTYSCAYIEETEKGSGINVKTANLTWVTSYMIKSTLTTAGIYDCNVVAASPFAVSGTGALTGIMKAFENLTGSELDESKKEIATEEIVISGTLADDIGSDQAVGIITDIKDTIIGENIVVADDIEQVIINSGNKYEVTLTDEQVEMILGTMLKISEQDYDYERLESTFSSIKEDTSDKLGIELDDIKKSFFEKIKDFFQSIADWFKNLFSSKNDSTTNSTNDTENGDNGILDQTDDSLLGDDVIIDSTVGDSNTTTTDGEQTSESQSSDDISDTNNDLENDGSDIDDNSINDDSLEVDDNSDIDKGTDNGITDDNTSLEDTSDTEGASSIKDASTGNE